MASCKGCLCDSTITKWLVSMGQDVCRYASLSQAEWYREARSVGVRMPKSNWEQPAPFRVCVCARVNKGDSLWLYQVLKNIRALA